MTAAPAAAPVVPVDVQTYARIYAGLGWPVFALQPGAKAPATPHGVKDATTDPDAIARMFARPGLNIGIATGVAFLVLDIDTAKGGEDALAAWEAQHGPLPATLTARTRAGGLHLLFALPADGRKIGNRAGIAPGIDVRGEGGYIAAEPSEVPPDPGGPGTGRYQWQDWEVSEEPPPDIAQAPDWLLERVAPSARTAAPLPAPAPASGAADAYAQAALHRAIGAVQTAPEGTRNNTLYAEAAGLARLAAAGRLDWHQAAGLLAGSAAAAGLDPAEIVRTLESAHRSGSENPKPPALPAPASAAPQPADVLREIDIAAIDGPLPAPDYVIEGAIPAGEVALLGAHGGTGKSFVALALACHVATGRDFGPWRVPRAREVFFVSLEDGAHRLLRRLRSIAAAFGFTTADLSLRLRIIDATAAEPLAAEVRAPGFAPSLEPTDTHRQLRDRVREGALIVIDNASDGFDANENERRLVRAFIRLLRRDLARGKGAVLLLAHTPKDAAEKGRESYSGSTAWHNSARARLALARKADALLLSVEKFNDGKPAAPLRLIVNDEGVPLLAGEEDAPPPSLLSTADADVLRAIEQAAAAGSPVPAARAGARTAGSVLHGLLHGLHPRRAIEDAIERLLANRQIEVTEHMTPARKRRDVLTPTGNRVAPNTLRQIPPYTPRANSAHSAQGAAPIGTNAPNTAFGAFGAFGADPAGQEAEAPHTGEVDL
jgi:KaiC/GvpD/RAD55 family RecA-like ATPase